MIGQWYRDHAIDDQRWRMMLMMNEVTLMMVAVGRQQCAAVLLRKRHARYVLLYLHAVVMVPIHLNVHQRTTYDGDDYAVTLGYDLHRMGQVMMVIELHVAHPYDDGCSYRLVAPLHRMRVMPCR